MSRKVKKNSKNDFQNAPNLSNLLPESNHNVIIIDQSKLFTICSFVYKNKCQINIFFALHKICNI